MKDTERIPLSHLLELMRDEETPPSKIRQYFKLHEQNSNAFAPYIVIDETKVDLGTDEAAVAYAAFNNWSRFRRAEKYKKKIRYGWKGVKLLTEGDSWFQYPIMLDDTIDYLLNGYAIRSLGAAGDLLSDMLDQGEVFDEFSKVKPDAILLSGGGNDLLGDGRLAIYIKEFVVGRPPRKYLNSQFSSFLNEAASNYGELISRLIEQNENIQIFCHSYAYAFPDNGKWLGRPMRKKNITDEKLQHEIIKVIIDRFHRKLLAIKRKHSNNVNLIDCRKLLPKKDDWHNELHPTSSGFKRVSDKFLTALKRKGFHPI